MCGRTCCSLDPQWIPYACTCVTDSVPELRPAPCGGVYYPSPNIPPTSYTPILFKSDEGSLVVQPMFWGLIPFWHKGTDPKGHKLSTNNARLEGLPESRLYKHSVEADKRCVVICDGFYEWKKIDKATAAKQPYLIYARQTKENNGPVTKDEDFKQVWNEDEGGQWTGKKPLFMAGLYNIWNPDGEKMKPVFSYSIITRESNKSLDWLHDRMPAILVNEKEVHDWLDEDIHGFDAIKALKPVQKAHISWHPVSREVGNVRNKEESLYEKVDLAKNGLAREKSEQKSSNLMQKWLKKKKEEKKDEEEEEEEQPEKKLKKEDT